MGFQKSPVGRKIDQVILVLPNTEDNAVLAWYLQSIGANLFRGSETNLVERYYQAAQQAGADQIVRVCADNLLICASEID